MSSERIIYLPLGGAGEIGMNAYVYGYGKPGEERLILVDIGVAFPDMDTTPGVDIIFADISWLKENRERLEAVFAEWARVLEPGAPVLVFFFASLDTDDPGAPFDQIVIVEEN